MSEPKKHHYIPVCYSANFTNTENYLQIMDLWEGSRTFPNKPEKAFTAKYMYSQPVYAESRFDNSIEHLFSREVESQWTPFINRMLVKNILTKEDWGYLVRFICSMLVRVPITFDAIIELLKRHVIECVPDDIAPPDELINVHLKSTGGNDGEKVTFEDLINSGTIDLNIDPHRCVTSMSKIISNIELFQPGFPFGGPKIIHNKSKVNFLSSDNPVCFFTGSINNNKFLPYHIQRGKPLKFIFPISSSMAVVNNDFVKGKSIHVDVKDSELIAKMNRVICKFSYRYVFSDQVNRLACAKKYQNTCPRPIYEKSVVGNGEVYKIAYKFGLPEKINNFWKYDISRQAN
ncbi:MULTISPECIES: DUF4238 domain-containing protein [unclassified Labrenzia]|uniref:DUF4238 domain-containing protein n=1 Tax=unclassified Labrenzia TaxID=2648686 RepID=UPI0004B6BAFE|nr:MULTISPECIES: DUF4238 domain-containing protein [unclassified Labrenzia]